MKERDEMTSSGKLDPSMAEAARHSDAPDVSTYAPPATTRMTSGSLALSIVVLIGAAIVALVVFLALF